jgi:endo-chitodextinase
LDAAGLNHIEMGWTTRWNAFYSNQTHTRPDGWRIFDSDGEGLLIEKELQTRGTSLNKLINWANIMLYDTSPSDLKKPKGITLETYKTVFEFFKKHVNEDLIVMGFEPGGQAAHGHWEGLEVDKEVISYVASQNLGGVSFWAMNQGPYARSQEITGKNSHVLATFAQSLF